MHRLALALALAALVSGCGVALRAPESVVAESPAEFSAAERESEIERLDLYIGDRMVELGLERGSETDADPVMDTRDVAVSGDDDDDDDDEPPAPPGPVDAPMASEAKVRKKGISLGSGSSARRDSTATHRCKRVCDAAEAICIAAERICKIADSLPEHPTAGKRCTRAKNDCEAAKKVAASCGCSF